MLSQRTLIVAVIGIAKSIPPRPTSSPKKATRLSPPAHSSALASHHRRKQANSRQPGEGTSASRKFPETAQSCELLQSHQRRRQPRQHHSKIRHQVEQSAHESGKKRKFQSDGPEEKPTATPRVSLPPAACPPRNCAIPPLTSSSVSSPASAATRGKIASSHATPAASPRA